MIFYEPEKKSDPFSSVYSLLSFHLIVTGNRKIEMFSASANLRTCSRRLASAVREKSEKQFGKEFTQSPTRNSGLVANLPQSQRSGLFTHWPLEM